MYIYARKSLFEEEQGPAEQAGFVVETIPSKIPYNTKNLLMRYTTQPFTTDVYADLNNRGIEPVNSLQQTKFLENFWNWYPVFQDLTPKSYSQEELHRLPSDKAFVVKGATNSRKSYWNTHMFAPDKAAAIRIASDLFQDSLIGSQALVVREYVPIKKTSIIGINDLPITYEYRVFFYKGWTVSMDYYWVNYIDDIPKAERLKILSHHPPKKLLEKIGKTLKSFTNFACVDFGLLEDGTWIIVELNDGAMAGLSCNNPKTFYEGLYVCMNTL